MKDKRLINKEILEDKNLDENIPVFMKRYSNYSYIHSGMQFVISYYNLYEAVKDREIELNHEASEILKEINNFIYDALISEDEEIIKYNIQNIDDIRNRISDKMQMLTIYSDRFLLYEYVLKRMFHNFDENLEDINENEVHNTLMNFIFSDKDNAAIFAKIREVIYHLPIRMTKNKFYDLIKNAINMYIGQECSYLDDFLYILKTSAGIKELYGEPEQRFEQKLKMFQEADYKGMQKESYDKLFNELIDIIKIIANETDIYYSYQEMINFLYAMLMNKEYVIDLSVDKSMDKSKEYLNKFKPLIEKINEGFKTDMRDIFDEIADLFESMEGKLEEYFEKIQDSQMIFSKIKDGDKELYSKYHNMDIYKCLDSSEKLLSSSLFIDLHKTEISRVVDKEYAERKASEIIDELVKRLSEQDKLLNRAMIASVLKELPVFLTSNKLVSDYIKGAFGSCHDIAERKVSYKLIMESSDELLPYI